MSRISEIETLQNTRNSMRGQPLKYHTSESQSVIQPLAEKICKKREFNRSDTTHSQSHSGNNQASCQLVLKLLSHELSGHSHVRSQLTFKLTLKLF